MKLRYSSLKLCSLYHSDNYHAHVILLLLLFLQRARDLEVEKTSSAIYNVIRAIEKFPTLDETVGGENDKIMQQKGGSDDSDEGEAEQEVHNDQNDVKDDVESLPTSGIPKNMSGSILKVCLSIRNPPVFNVCMKRCRVG